MKTFIVGFLAAFALVGSYGSPAALTIKFGTLAPQGSPWYNSIRDMAEAWKTASGGTVEVRIYAGGIAGDEPDLVRKIKIGQLHAAALTGGGLARIAFEVQALQMPMMFASLDEFDYVRERVGPKIEAILEKKGFKVLTWSDIGWAYFFAQKPVVHPDDLKPLRLFAWAGETAHIDAWKAAGYKPVPLAVTEIHTALQSGLINAFVTTPVAALSFQWFASAKHMTDLKWARVVGAVVISTRAWKKIPGELKPRFASAAREAGARLQAMLPELSAKAIEAMTKHGLQVHHVGPLVAKEWEKRARAGFPKIIGKIVPAGMVAEVERIRDAYRAKQAGRE